MSDPMDTDDWRVPSVAPDATTLISGRDFAISRPDGDMVRGAVHGLIHDDRRYLDTWSVRLTGLELRPLASVSPTPFSSVSVSRVHQPDGEPLPILLVRRRSVGRGMRETLELFNSGRTPRDIEVVVTVDSDFGHLFDVKSGHPSSSHGKVVPRPHGIDIVPESDTARHRTSIVTEPAVSDVGPSGWRWRLTIGPHAERSVRAVVTAHIDDDDEGPVPPPPVAAGTSIDELSHQRYEDWHARTPVVVSPDPRLAISVRTALEDLESLRIFDSARPDLAVVAAGAPWYMTLFGRDSLLTAQMALPFAPELARGVLSELAELQGEHHDPRSGEQPGKILHEVRTHGGSGPFRERSRYYGTVDATPLFVMVAAEAVRWGAVSLVDDPWLVTAVDAAMTWIREHGDSDGDGFVDYAVHDEHGLTNQGWKDSWDGVNRADGTLPEAPIALIEVQGYVYAALRGAASMYAALGRDDEATACERDADALRHAVDERFRDGRGWYVQALDGSGRAVDSLGSNPGHALWTGVADPVHADRYLDEVLTDPLWSGWGVRTLATSMGRYDPLSYHNGSVWPHDTAICLAGAARYGRWDVVDTLTDGLLDTAMAFGGRLPELFAGVSRRLVPVPVPYPGSCSPQAWASASVLLVLRANLGLDADVSEGIVTVNPRGRLAADVTCEGLHVGGRRVTINIAAGEVDADGDGLRVVDTR